MKVSRVDIEITEWSSGHQALEAMIIYRFNRLERMMAETQAQLDAIVSQINTATSDLTSEVAALKAQPAAADLDFSGLDDAVSALQSLDVANTPVVSPTPVPASPVEDPNAV